MFQYLTDGLLAGVGAPGGGLLLLAAVAVRVVVAVELLGERRQGALEIISNVSTTRGKYICLLSY